jgi:hypothetical protein
LSHADVARPARIRTGERTTGRGSEVDGEQIDTGGRVDEMGNAFAQKYGTSYVLKDEVADEALYALLADDDQTRERIGEHSGLRVRVKGAKLPEEAGDEVTRVNVEEIEQA